MTNLWPYPEIFNRYKAGDRSWFETTEDVYWDQLGSVPPYRHNGKAFVVGVPWDHTPDDIPIATVFVQVAGRYFCRMIALNEWKPAIFWKEILKKHF